MKGIKLEALADVIFHNVGISEKKGIESLSDADLATYRSACMVARESLNQQLVDATRETLKRNERKTDEMRAELAARRAEGAAPHRESLA